jgi:hypothetical protein
MKRTILPAVVLLVLILGFIGIGSVNAISNMVHEIFLTEIFGGSPPPSYPPYPPPYDPYPPPPTPTLEPTLVPTDIPTNINPKLYLPEIIQIPIIY